MMSECEMTENKSGPVYLFFEMEINWASFRLLETRVAELISGGLKELVLVMSTGGGGCGAAVTCYNFLKSLNIDITTYNICDVNSASLLMFMAESKRYVVPSGRFLIHPLTYEVNGSFTMNEYTDILENMRSEQARIAQIYATTLNIPKQKAEGLFQHEHWVNAETARDMGIATAISSLSIPEGARLEILPLPHSGE